MMTIYYRPTEGDTKNPRAYWLAEDGTPEVLCESMMPQAGWSYDIDRLHTGVLSEDDVTDYASVLRALRLVDMPALDAHVPIDDHGRYLDLVERQQGEIAAEWMRMHIESCEESGTYIDLTDAGWTDWSQVPDLDDVDDVRAAFDRTFA